MKNKHAETGLNTLEEQLKKARVEINLYQIRQISILSSTVDKEDESGDEEYL